MPRRVISCHALPGHESSFQARQVYARKAQTKSTPADKPLNPTKLFCKHLCVDPCLAISWGPVDHLTVENVLYPKRIEEAGDRQSPETVTSETRIRNQDE